MSSLSALWNTPEAQWLVAVSLLSGGVFVVVRFADALLARIVGPRARMVLYSLVLVRLLLPVDWTSPVGLLGGGQASVAAATATPAAAAPSIALEAPTIAVPWLSRAPASAAVISDHAAPVVGASTLFAIYGAGLLILACLALWRRRSLQRIISASTPLPSANSTDGILVLQHATAGPFASGLLNKVVVVPKALVETLSAAEMHCVVAHERAHHAGRDVWVAAALRFVSALAWPIVPVWLATHRVRALVEHAADVRATAGDADGGRYYARVLLSLVEHAPSPAAASHGLGAYRDLRARVVAIVRRPRTSGPLQALAVGAVAALVLACAAVAEDPTTAPRAADCGALAERAKNLHDSAEKGAGGVEHPQVHDAYVDYLDQCSEHADYPEMMYYAAEAQWAWASRLFATGDEAGASRTFADAQMLFDRAIDEGTDLLDDAAYAQHLSARNATGWKPSPKAPACEGDNCGAFTLVPYDAAEREVLRSWERYADVVGRPLSGKPREQLAIATLAMQHNDFDRARPELTELVDAHPGTDHGLSAAEMLVDALTIAWTTAAPEQQAERGKELATLLAKLDASATVQMEGAEKLREAIDVLQAGIAWKRAMATLASAEASGDPSAYRTCAEQFDALVRQYPDHDQVAALQRNAQRCRDQAEN